jgi:hypothetical protein
MDGSIDGRVGFCFEYGATLGFMAISGGVLLFSARLWYFRGAHMVVDVLGRQARTRMVSGTELGFLGATILISLVMKMSLRSGIGFIELIVRCTY